jgi:hypothetical protein
MQQMEIILADSGVTIWNGSRYRAKRNDFLIPVMGSFGTLACIPTVGTIPKSSGINERGKNQE